MIMEPMALGSPGGSPSSSNHPYLPSFLMGEQQMPASPRNNTLSPNKSGTRNVSFGYANSPSSVLPNTSHDFNRSMLAQKTLFGGYQQTPPLAQNLSGYCGTPLQSHNVTQSGPPTQGLFDSLHNELQETQTPGRLQNMNPYGTPNSSQQVNRSSLFAQQYNSSCNEQQSIMSSNNHSFNVSRAGIISPLAATSPLTSTHLNTTNNLNNMNINSINSPQMSRYTEFWVTVYGFPTTATSTILQHFAQCGTIVDKVFPPQNGNWVHLKYSSRLECDKALSYNEKILANNIMIGVTQCKDHNVFEKENHCSNSLESVNKVRPLAQIAYKNAQNEISVNPTGKIPQKSTGLVNKALDLFFGW